MYDLLWLVNKITNLQAFLPLFFAFYKLTLNYFSPKRLTQKCHSFHFLMLLCYIFMIHSSRFASFVFIVFSSFCFFSLLTFKSFSVGRKILRNGWVADYSGGIVTRRHHWPVQIQGRTTRKGRRLECADLVAYHSLRHTRPGDIIRVISERKQSKATHKKRFTSDSQPKNLIDNNN